MAQEPVVVKLPIPQLEKQTKEYRDSVIPLFKQSMQMIIMSELSADEKTKKMNLLIDNMIIFLNKTDELQSLLGI